MFQCRYYQSRMVAYLHGELSPKARRRMALHIDNCPSCYTVYVYQRELVQGLVSHLPSVGQPQPQQLARMWAAIQSETRRVDRRRYPARYGFVALVLMLALVLPWTLGNRNVPFTIPVPPTPFSEATLTPNGTTSKSAATVALNVTTNHDNTPGLPAHSTPSPQAAR